MKILIVNKSDSTGGAAVVSRRLLEAFKQRGIDTKMLVVEKLTDNPFVFQAAPQWREKIPFITERLKIFAANGLNRSTLFKIDTASDGLPLHRHPLIKEADVIILNWINQGMLSLSEIEKIALEGKKIIWTMHDMWNTTGVCHHAGKCNGYLGECGSCPLLGKKGSPEDISHSTLLRKKALYDKGDIKFVAVSNWLADKARHSTLLRDASISVIPNPFPLHSFASSDGEYAESDKESGVKRKKRIIFGAARIDDPIKGFPIFIRALEIFKERYPELASQTSLLLYGAIRDNSLLAQIPITYDFAGVVSGEKALEKLYRKCDIVVSASSYETLPGTLVEGQAFGCVPVAFHHGGQGDIIDHLSTGYLCEWDDDPERRSELLAEGIAAALQFPADTTQRMASSVASRFSYQAVTDKYLALINS